MLSRLFWTKSVQFSSVAQSLFATPMTAARQASLFVANTRTKSEDRQTHSLHPHLPRASIFTSVHGQ